MIRKRKEEREGGWERSLTQIRKMIWVVVTDTRWLHTLKLHLRKRITTLCIHTILSWNSCDYLIISGITLTTISLESFSHWSSYLSLEAHFVSRQLFSFTPLHFSKATLHIIMYAWDIGMESTPVARVDMPWWWKFTALPPGHYESFNECVQS